MIGWRNEIATAERGRETERLKGDRVKNEKLEHAAKQMHAISTENTSASGISTKQRINKNVHWWSSAQCVHTTKIEQDTSSTASLLLRKHPQTMLKAESLQIYKVPPTSGEIREGVGTWRSDNTYHITKKESWKSNKEHNPNSKTGWKKWRHKKSWKKLGKKNKMS